MGKKKRKELENFFKFIESEPFLIGGLPEFAVMVYEHRKKDKRRM